MPRHFSCTLECGIDVNVEYSVDEDAVVHIGAITPLGMPMISVDVGEDEIEALEAMAQDHLWGEAA